MSLKGHAPATGTSKCGIPHEDAFGQFRLRIIRLQVCFLEHCAYTFQKMGGVELERRGLRTNCLPEFVNGSSHPSVNTCVFRRFTAMRIRPFEKPLRRTGSNSKAPHFKAGSYVGGVINEFNASFIFPGWAPNLSSISARTVPTAPFFWPRYIDTDRIRQPCHGSCWVSWR